jgi:Ni/Co efflux regulator RcnB
MLTNKEGFLMKRFLSVLIASMFLASAAAYAAEDKMKGDEKKVEAKEKGKGDTKKAEDTKKAGDAKKTEGKKSDEKPAAK